MEEDHSVVIECATCRARVSHAIEAVQLDPDAFFCDVRYLFAVCHGCKSPAVARQVLASRAEGWGGTERVWPRPRLFLPAVIPEIVRVSLQEAESCHTAGANTACAVMCGRALEGVCKHFDVEATLAKGLQKLLQRGLIDQRLLEWGTELRVLRNVAAHATEVEVSRDESTDALHFTMAICEYVFVLTARFEAFKKRRKQKLEDRGAPPPGDESDGEAEPDPDIG